MTSYVTKKTNKSNNRNIFYKYIVSAEYKGLKQELLLKRVLNYAIESVYINVSSIEKV